MTVAHASISNPTSYGTDTVVAREVAWLSTANDGLPRLIKANVNDTTAPFDFIEGYWPNPTTSSRCLYVLRAPGFTIVPWSTGRELSRHTMRLTVWWPILGDQQNDQADLDVALDMLTQRIAGPQFSKTHGNRFMSAAEVRSGGGITVAIQEPERADGQFRAYVTYVIDDTELNI